jgi:hypothetical protein
VKWLHTGITEALAAGRQAQSSVFRLGSAWSHAPSPAVLATPAMADGIAVSPTGHNPVAIVSGLAACTA